MRGALIFGWGLMFAVACSVPAEQSVDAGTDAGGDESWGFCTGDGLFGRPSPNTGLSDEECTDICVDCADGPFSAPLYDEAFVEALLAWELVDPPAALEANPYEEPEIWPLDEASVCAVVVVDEVARTYRLETFPSASDADDAGAIITHDGACGLCSDLESLAVYAGVGDLTEPVRQCGIQAMVGGQERGMECLMDIGFNEACASIWYWNTVNTREHCQDLCLAQFGDPYHLPDGSLNSCLQCDEEISGPVFKAVAGRTRRNSGLATALCRPCSEVRPLVHSYE